MTTIRCATVSDGKLLLLTFDRKRGTMDVKGMFARLFAANPPPADDKTSFDCRPLLEQLMPEKLFTIVDVGAQNLAAETHIYKPLCTPEIKHRVIGFEPLEDKATERSVAEDATTIIYPVAIGDGSTQTLYVNNDDATSSIYPLNEPFCADFEHLHTLKAAREIKVETTRLDDVLPPGSVEFLKLDIQGAELMALQNATKVLERTAVVHCEVEFDQIYVGQPLFHEIQDFLLKRGFFLVDLLISHRYAYENSAVVSARDRLIWADAVYFKKTDDKTVLGTQAVIAALVYDKPTLAIHLADRAKALA